MQHYHSRKYAGEENGYFHPTLQISAGLEYLHSRGTAHFDLKSDNVLVFHFPTPQFALESTTPGAIKLTRQQSLNPHKTALQLKEDDPTAILVKITDLGISRQSSLGQYRHRGGTPGFMAPEILRYSGKEAVQSKVDVFSFAMVMYEMVSLQCPFEAEGLHPQQIDKLTVDGKRPILSSRVSPTHTNTCLASLHHSGNCTNINIVILTIS